MATGWNRSFFVDANGALLACGKEEEGEVGLLGLREGTSQTPFTAVVPTPVPSMAGIRVRAVACFNNCNLVVSEAGQVFEWGLQVQPLAEEGIGWSKRQPPVPTVMEELRNHRVHQVAAGGNHCAALTEDGALFTWETLRRANTRADKPVPGLGYGRCITDYGVPCRVFAFEGMRIASVAVGEGFTVAVTEAGAVYSFSEGDGRLGHWRSNGENVLLPKRIEALDGLHVVSVAAGDWHALDLTKCGRVYLWGADGRDGLVHGLSSAILDLDDDDFDIPQLITALLGERVRAIAAGPDVSCAVTDAGALYTWGEDECGSLGHGDVCGRNMPDLVQGLHGIRVVEVSSYDTHTLALAADGSIYAFGEGTGLGISQVGAAEEVDEPMRSPLLIPNLHCMVRR
jgi:alpha-tubulin suppressor-like RCC1 family protein